MSAFTLPILELPPEILDTIFLFTSRGDLKNISLACSAVLPSAISYRAIGTGPDIYERNTTRNFNIRFGKERENIKVFDDRSRALWRRRAKGIPRPLYGHDYLDHANNAKKLLDAHLPNLLGLSSLHFTGCHTEGHGPHT
jgi:hypothetical protein